MYYLYNRTVNREKLRFRNAGEELHLFGCNKGIIARHLSVLASDGDIRGFGWEIPMRQALSAASKPGNSFMIDLRPYDVSTVGLYEVTAVYGFSYSKRPWTVIMLKTIPVMERTRAGVDPYDSSIKRSVYRSMKPVYTILYAQGTLKKGKVVGSWNPPGPGSTSAPVLYPDALKSLLARIDKRVLPKL